jgi:16S rRNA (adenine1518-N6/adenine1519-N6)-dimethyltransferase
MRGARWLIDSLRDKQPFDKSLGQHFLVNDELIARAVELGDVSEQDHVLEIGPGPGVLTEALLSTGCKLTAIEIDAGAVEHLRGALHQKSNQNNLLSLKAMHCRLDGRKM